VQVSGLVEEMKRLMTKPLTIFNGDIFTSLIEKVLINAEGKKPSSLRFAFYCKLETIEPVTSVNLKKDATPPSQP
jgi:hypothetical protein